MRTRTTGRFGERLGSRSGSRAHSLNTSLLSDASVPKARWTPASGRVAEDST